MPATTATSNEREMRARFRSQCATCPNGIEPGDLMVWNSTTRKARHLTCVDPAGTTQASPTAEQAALAQEGLAIIARMSALKLDEGAILGELDQFGHIKATRRTMAAKLEQVREEYGLLSGLLHEARERYKALVASARAQRHSPPADAGYTDDGYEASKRIAHEQWTARVQQTGGKCEECRRPITLANAHGRWGKVLCCRCSQQHCTHPRD